MKKILITSIIILLNLGVAISQTFKNDSLKESVQGALSALHKEAFVRTRELEKTDLKFLLTQETFALELFSDLTIVVQKISETEQMQGGNLWHGRLIEGAKGYVDLFLRNGLVSGSVYTSSGVYKLNGTLEGKLRVTELLRNNVDDGAHEHLEEETVVLERRNSQKLSRGTALNPCVIDVMVVYPQVLEDDLGGPQATENEVLFRIAEANQVFVNSEVFIIFRLTHHQVATSVPADAEWPGDVNTTEVSALRDLYKADLVSFWNVGGASGIAYTFNGRSSSGINNCSYNAVANQYTFVHECGHNIGAGHDRQAYYEQSPTSGALNSAPHDSYGKSFINTRSIMSYSNCGDVIGATGGCSRIPYFTNPNVIVDGVSFGVEGTEQTYDVNGPANNARVLNENASVVEAYYENTSIVDYDLTVINGAGSGTYSEKTVVSIVADEPVLGMIFDQWTGDVASVSSVNNASTTIKIEANLTVTATYKSSCDITPVAPSVSNKELCESGIVTFSATGSDGGILKWYSDVDGVNELAEGNTFSVDVSQTSAYYVRETFSGLASKVGMEEKIDLDGRYYEGGSHLIMDVESAFTLKSAKVYAEVAGNRTFELRNKNGELLLSKSIYVEAGESRVSLDFDIPVENNLTIGTEEDALKLHRSKGASYPYVAEGIVSIKNSTVSSDYYYSLYDWEITTGDNSLCLPSPSSEVTVTLRNCVGLSTYDNENLILFPNPTSGIVHLKLPEDFQLKIIQVTDILGNSFLTYDKYVEKVDLQEFKSGAYLVKVVGEQGTKVFKVEVR